MPYINSKVSTPMSDAQRESLKERLGNAVSIFPEKTEEWLMLELADNCDPYVQGEKTPPSAYMEIKVFGEISQESLDEITKEVCSIHESDPAMQQKTLI